MNGILLGEGKTRKEGSLYIYGTLAMCQALSLEAGRRWNYLSWHRAGAPEEVLERKSISVYMKL